MERVKKYKEALQMFATQSVILRSAELASPDSLSTMQNIT